MNDENLTPFGPDNPPKSPGRPLGSLNRKTIYQRWLLQIHNGEFMTEADKIAIAVIQEAKQGDIPAAKEAFDSGFGKNEDKVDQKITHDMTQEVYRLLTDEQLAQLKIIMDKKNAGL